MKVTATRIAAWMAVLLVVLLAHSTPGIHNDVLPLAAAPAGYTIHVLNPQGPIKKARELAPRLPTLEGKKVAMWLSATPDQVFAGRGAELYDLLAKMLKEKIPGISIVPYSGLPMKFAPANEVVAAITAVKPDAVVAAFGG